MRRQGSVFGNGGPPMQFFGDLRRVLDAFDLLRALIGVSHAGSGTDWQQSAKRLVDILIAGLRPVK